VQAILRILEENMTGTNAVIDVSHHNGKVDFVRAKAAGIAGVIQKATQGFTYIDPTFARNRAAISTAGLRFGAYHFGTGGDGVEQADFFLNQVKPQPGDLLVLDFEANSVGPSMDLEQARAFITHVQAITGLWPGLYSGSYLKEHLGTQADPVLTNCWLWMAQYGPTPVIPPAWNKWTLWQYTDGGLGPVHEPVDGVGACDRDMFNGTADELVAFWTASSLPPVAAALDASVVEAPPSEDTAEAPQEMITA
jgi:lysozyme